jgi:ACS family pantothenate transporter-like MFS transporter
MGYWLKSFDKKPFPVPGTTFSVPQINNCEFGPPEETWALADFILVPLTTIGIFIVVAITWAWLSDGPCRGARWPFIYIGAALTVSSQAPRTIVSS